MNGHSGREDLNSSDLHLVYQKKKGEVKQISTLLYHLGEEVESVLASTHNNRR